LRGFAETNNGPADAKGELAIAVLTNTHINTCSPELDMGPFFETQSNPSIYGSNRIQYNLDIFTTYIQYNAIQSINIWY